MFTLMFFFLLTTSHSFDRSLNYFTDRGRWAVCLKNVGSIPEQRGARAVNITNIQPLSVSKSGNTWTLRVRYTATFTNQEKDAPLNYVFRDSIQIWEDDLFSDDQITGWVSASNFNPSENSVVR